MKVLFKSTFPAMLVRGGMQVRIDQSKAALEQIGVATAFL